MPPTPKPPEMRFWRHVHKTGECWLWTGGRSGGQTLNGGRGAYGSFNVKAGPLRGRYAHRFSYRLHHGPIPEGMYVCHRCDNPICVRPDHLFLGTAADNNTDMARKDRHARGERHGYATSPERWARGERQGGAKLTGPAVLRIREEYARGGITQSQLALEHGVSRRTIGMVVTGRTWTHLLPHNLREAVLVIDRTLEGA